MNKEITRSTVIVVVLPNPEALLRVAGAVLIDPHDDLASADRRYFSEACLATPTADTSSLISDIP